MNFLKAKLFLILCLVAGLAVGATIGYVHHLRAKVIELTIAKNNALADADKLKLVAANVYERLARQNDHLVSLRDSLKKAGTAKTVTTVTVTPKPKTETHVTTTAPPPSDSTLLLSDSVVGPPVDIRATVALQAHADSSLTQRWQWWVNPAPIPLTIDVGCRERYKPDVLVKAPPWVRLDSVETTTKIDVCGKEPKHHGFGWWALRVGGLVGLGAGAEAALN